MAGRDIAAIQSAQEYVAEEAPCGTCGGVSLPASFIYVPGNIKINIPSEDVEKEVAQAIGRLDTVGKTDQHTLHSLLSLPENRYLVRELCWVLTIQGLETYLLRPSDPAGFSLLVEATRPTHDPGDIDLVIGIRGPIAPPEMCNGLMIPIVNFDHVFSFPRKALIDAIPKPENISAAKFRAVAEELFDRIMQMTDNAGSTDEHRAANYLAMRCKAIYELTAVKFEQDFSLTGIEVRPSPLSGTRNLVDIIFSFTNRKTDFTEKFFVCVDVTGKFPFMFGKLKECLR